MSLDDFLDSWSEDQIEQARFERERELAEWRHELEQRDEGETPEAEEARWQHKMRVAHEQRPAVHYDERPGIDLRMFAKRGDIEEQARRDAVRHQVGGDAA